MPAEFIISQGCEEEGTSEGVRASVLASNFCQRLQHYVRQKHTQGNMFQKQRFCIFLFLDSSLILETDLPFLGTKRCLLLFFFFL